MPTLGGFRRRRIQPYFFLYSMDGLDGQLYATNICKYRKKSAQFSSARCHSNLQWTPRSVRHCTRVPCWCIVSSHPPCMKTLHILVMVGREKHTFLRVSDGLVHYSIVLFHTVACQLQGGGTTIAKHHVWRA